MARWLFSAARCNDYHVNVDSSTHRTRRMLIEFRSAGPTADEHFGLGSLGEDVEGRGGRHCRY
jgi:hypothetical protein